MEPYPEDYMKCTEAAKEELREDARPRLKEYLEDISGYDNIVVAGPCWWGTYPCAIFTQLEMLDFKGKKVFPVMTHEGSGEAKSRNALKSLCTGAKIGKAFAVQGAVVPGAEAAVADWARKKLK